MIFTLEALKAQHGDCLLLHYGKDDDPRLILIDGGPGPVFKESLLPRLEELRAARAGADESLPLDMLMVSHIDDDHIGGVLGLTQRLLEEKDAETPPLVEIDTLWHNSFDDITKNDEVLGSPASITASLGDFLPPDELHQSELVLASVGQGRTLRDQGKVLANKVNSPFKGLVRSGKKRTDVKRPDGLVLTVIGPRDDRLANLQKTWNKELEKLLKGKPKEKAQAAAFVDDAVANLSSIIVLAQAKVGKKTRTMLLTGDANGKFVLSGLEDAGLLKQGGSMHVDVLKLPHHGSIRNVDTPFFERITADHYVFSANGKFGNPDPPTLQMLADVRQDDTDYTIHLTTAPEDCKAPYPAAKARQILKGSKAKIATPAPGKLSLRIDLGAKLPED
ncbi:MAG TPA: hypothetical protein VGS57_22740 [Thermoanaerobaculia bacterium]|jgi:hypothetical protein|nr:hypothetical protein [Thermoanaerobaculia bacterium]